MKPLKLFIPITKVDEEQRLVYGVATAEHPDQSGEICDYATTVPYYKAWSERIASVTGGKSKGNLRAMHASVAAGKITDIAFNDEDKQIELCCKVVDNDEWEKVLEGVYTGFSQGGRYIKSWKDGSYTRYTADPSEVSLVDNPCLPEATFTLLRASGNSEMRKFKSVKKNTETSMQHDMATLTKTINHLNKSIETLNARIKQLESQPAAAKGTLYRVEKGHELQDKAEPVAISHHPYAIPARVSPEEYRRNFE